MYKIIAKENTYDIDFEGRNQGTVNGENFRIDTSTDVNGRIHLLKNNKSYDVEIVEADFNLKKFVVKVNGSKYELEAKDRLDLLLKELGMENLSESKVKDIKAPMPGLVLELKISEGQEISKGDAILVLEAMKMENILKSPTDGIVKSISVKIGDAVEKNQVLIDFE